MKLSKKRLKELSDIKDSDIDFSDIPETDATFWKDAKIIEPDPTVLVTVRLRKSTLAFFQYPQKKGYQTRIKKVLAAYKNAHEWGKSNVPANKHLS